jgi:hypothetical protein
MKVKFLTAITGKTKIDRIRNAYNRDELRMEERENKIEANRF